MKPEWLHEDSLQQLFAATEKAGGQARVVGGAVRDFLMGCEGSDVDIASTLLPERTMEIAAQQGWKAVPTGIDHGTVTLVLPGRVVEVTTLRRDVATDGRHATVAFTDDWREDASRRDFTINALSMDAAGELYDFFDGQADIAAGRVRFIGDANHRIAEDGLRILRFFRFLAGHGKPPADVEALAACTAKKDMIAKLSGERIANEMRKLLQVENPAFALRLMADSGVAAHVFLGDITPSRMIRLAMLEAQADYQTSVWARVLLLLGVPASAARPHPEFSQKKIQTSPEGEVSESRSGATFKPLPRERSKSPVVISGEGVRPIDRLIARWKLSRHEAQQLKLLEGLPPFEANAPRHVHTRILRLHGAPAYLDWLLIQAALQPGLNIAPYVHLAHDFTPPKFPIAAADLMARGMKEGKALGEALAMLEQRWEESDYTLGKEVLLSAISE
ncbi:MAG: CCA tRNA nucleotidyltransferase [Rickettsiales bacterium]